MEKDDWIEDVEKRLPTCCICGEKYVGYGNNAEPYMKGLCCNKCNETLVIPHRVTLIVDSWGKEKSEK